MVDFLTSAISFMPFMEQIRYLEVVEVNQHEEQCILDDGVRRFKVFRWRGDDVECVAKSQITDVVDDGWVIISIILIFVFIAWTTHYLHKVSIKCRDVLMLLRTLDHTLCFGVFHHTTLPFLSRPIRQLFYQDYFVAIDSLVRNPILLPAT